MKTCRGSSSRRGGLNERPCGCCVVRRLAATVAASRRQFGFGAITSALSCVYLFVRFEGASLREAPVLLLSPCIHTSEFPPSSRPRDFFCFICTTLYFSFAWAISVAPYSWRPKTKRRYSSSLYLCRRSDVYRAFLGGTKGGGGVCLCVHSQSFAHLRWKDFCVIATLVGARQQRSRPTEAAWRRMIRIARPRRPYTFAQSPDIACFFAANSRGRNFSFASTPSPTPIWCDVRAAPHRRLRQQARAIFVTIIVRSASSSPSINRKTL